MSTDGEVFDEEKSFVEEDVEQLNIGLYIGGRNSKGERNGKGWAILPNGDHYDGQYRKGQRYGIGLYVFKDGSRYFGQYRCGTRSGRGIFIYPDGSYYEGEWRRNLKHGKGRYFYSNGDSYCGNWYRGQRHGVGTYTYKGLSSAAFCDNICFTGTWRQGVRVGPFKLNFEAADKTTTLHGSWDNLYPQGPCVFSFSDRYLLRGYFRTPEAWLTSEARREDQIQSHFEEESTSLKEVEAPLFKNGSSLWYAQDMCAFDVSLLPQEPVPLPLSDSEISVCSVSTAATAVSVEKLTPTAGNGEAEVGEEGNLECFPYEMSSSGAESSSQMCPQHVDPCGIEINTQNKC